MTIKQAAYNIKRRYNKMFRENEKALTDRVLNYKEYADAKNDLMDWKLEQFKIMWKTLAK